MNTGISRKVQTELKDLGVIILSSYLLSVGHSAEQSLPVIFTALSCGAALPVSALDVFSFSRNPGSSAEASSLASSFSSCHYLMEDIEGFPAFRSMILFQSCIPVFRDLRTLSSDPDTSLLFDALRGKGLPFSFHSDREAVEWCFADLLSRPGDPSVQSFFSWLSKIVSSSKDKNPVRLTILADLSDPYAAGLTLVLLPFIRDFLSNRSVSVFISLLALAETSSPIPETFFPVLSSSLRDLDSRSLLRQTDDEPSYGADAMWLLSLPSSMVKDPDSHRVTALAAARILGQIFSREQLPASGFHTTEIDGTLSLASLRDDAPVFTAFLRSAVWMLSDLIPSIRTYLSSPARLRSIAMNPRTGMFRRLFSGSVQDNLSGDLLLLESTLRTFLTGVLSFVRSIPAALRPSGANASLWQQAVNACGRYITVSSEYDVSAAEARESGLDSVRPVHRVSMADTEEEQLLRRIQQMERQLEEESRALDKCLSSLGGYRALQVRLDCYNRCSAALKDAREKAGSSPDSLDHLSLMKRARRVRLLEAAVTRCREDLYPATVQAALSKHPSGKTDAADPYAFCPLIPEGCRALESFLTGTGENPQPVPSVDPAAPETDPKSRLKALVSLCRDVSPARPVPFLFAQVYAVCSGELVSARFLTDSLMPDVPLLPDVIAETPLLRICDVLSRIPGQPAREQETAELRGIISMLLLREYHRRDSSEASLVCTCCLPDASMILDYWLSSRRADRVYIISLEQHDIRLPFAIILPGQEFIAARRTAAHSDLVPSFITWFDREKSSFMDPCRYLGEGDRLLVKRRISSFLEAIGSAEAPLVSFLSDFLKELSRDPEPFSADKHLKTRLQAVCGLFTLPAYQSSLTKQYCFYEHFLASDELGSCITGQNDFPPDPCTEIPENAMYLYRSVPFAREDSRLLLSSLYTAEEDYTLSRLSAECDVLSESSDDYRDALMINLQKLLDKNPDALPDTRETASRLLEEAATPVERREPVFVWPWDEKSPSIQTVLQESLGDSLPADALNPFSDVLTLFPARGHDVIGDALLSSMCTVLPHENLTPENETDISPDAVLPPLSTSFGRSLCLTPEGRTLLKPGLLKFERFREDKPGFSSDISDAFRVTLTLDGAFPVHLVRVYTSEEILYLYAHDIPTLAVWPSVPFRLQDWHAYYVYAHISDPFTASVLSSSGTWSDFVLTSEERYSSVLDTFPVCFALSRGEKTAGILPNILPEPLVESSDPVEICIDFGSAGTSVVFSSRGSRRPMHGPVMVRTLLNNPVSSRDLLRREFLPAVPVSALLPTVSRIFRNVPGAAPVPFTDGIVLMSSDLEDLLSTPSDAIYTSLKWEEEKGRSGFLCLHQIMLMAALQARFEGASAIAWRFSVPDEMAKEGRETLMNLFTSLCESVLQESGYASSVPDGVLPVSFATESSALGAYFRFCAADDTRGGFMVLDLGACTADISLFLRGREQAVRTCQIPLGVHYMLLPTLLRDPDLLIRDFGYCTEEAFHRDLSMLSRALSDARTDPIALRRARISLDYFIADHLPQLLSFSLQMASAGRPSYSGALILLYFSYLMTLSGLVLLQLAADPSKNDFLPEQMTLCLSGRGASILEALPPPMKTSLWHFLSMFRNKRVASLSLLFSAEKKMEIPVGLSLLREVYSGLPPASAVPASIAVRPAELLPEFLLRFCRLFPASAGILFPGFFSNDSYQPFTVRGQALISSSIDLSFPPTDNPRPYDSLSAWIGNLLELVQTSV